MSLSSADSPFRAIHADAWAAPADVATLNKEVSDLILARIDEVRRAGAREDLALTSSSVLLLGPAGAGKTHLFTRLRAQAGRRAVFIHTRPQIGVEPTPRFVLRSILDSLKQRIAGGDEMQIDLVAGAILAAHEGDKPRFPLAKVEQVRALPPDEQRALFERVIARVEERFPGIVYAFLLRLLEVPFASRPDRRALLTWLSGGEPSVVELERIGAPGPLPDMDVMSALSTLGIAAAYGAPVVLVFDQLENLAEDGGRTGRIHAHARLVERSPRHRPRLRDRADGARRRVEDAHPPGPARERSRPARGDRPPARPAHPRGAARAARALVRGAARGRARALPARGGRCVGPRSGHDPADADASLR